MSRKWFSALFTSVCTQHSQNFSLSQRKFGIKKLLVSDPAMTYAPLNFYPWKTTSTNHPYCGPVAVPCLKWSCCSCLPETCSLNATSNQPTWKSYSTSKSINPHHLCFLFNLDSSTVTHLFVSILFCKFLKCSVAFAFALVWINSPCKLSLWTKYFGNIYNNYEFLAKQVVDSILLFFLWSRFFPHIIKARLHCLLFCFYIIQSFRSSASMLALQYLAYGTTT